MNTLYSGDKINKKATDREIVLLRQLAEKVDYTLGDNSSVIHKNDLKAIQEIINDIKIVNML